ncbi:mRNA interferase MazF6 [Rubripirellula obstinata]|uniref:mRNA interferase MazF6 n=1 Tax=Rubripirellula obstinata TaxID=406547 RepID=A0A5B1CQ30_9BACT|nr:type II toxin-antitoxin system PemK/MazF family toxin [Rubripirellula obstinata]KAA1262085.1 mRNA interferase MazF6 [Rubripirellula obstinata]
MSAGDIHWVDLPGAGGRSQMGRRPAIIIQDDVYGGKLPTILVVPLTSSKAAMRFAATTLVAATTDSGLRNDSVALVFQCVAIDRRQVLEQMGQASGTERVAILAELAKLTGQSG